MNRLLRVLRDGTYHDAPLPGICFRSQLKIKVATKQGAHDWLIDREGVGSLVVG